MAVQNENASILCLLIDAGLNINIADRLQRTPLHWAALNRSLHVAKVLFDAGANVALKDCFDRTTLDMSLHSYETALTVLLLDHGAWPSGKGLQLALYAAAEQGSAHLVERLVIAGADPLKKGMYGQTPFHYAENRGNYETAKTILTLCEGRGSLKKSSTEAVSLVLKENDPK